MLLPSFGDLLINAISPQKRSWHCFQEFYIVELNLAIIIYYLNENMTVILNSGIN